MRLCQEVEAALKEADPDQNQKEIVQAAKAKRDAELNKLQETLRKVNEIRDKLSEKLLRGQITSGANLKIDSGPDGLTFGAPDDSQESSPSESEPAPSGS